MNKKILKKIIMLAEEEGIPLDELDEEICKERGSLKLLNENKSFPIKSDDLYILSEYLRADLIELLDEELNILQVEDEISIGEFLVFLRKLTACGKIEWNYAEEKNQNSMEEVDSNSKVKGIYSAVLPEGSVIRLVELDDLNKANLYFRVSEKKWMLLTSTNLLTVEGSEYKLQELTLLLFEVKKQKLKHHQKIQNKFKKETQKMAEIYKEILESECCNDPDIRGFRL